MRILLVGCSWTAGTDAERPAPAEYLDTTKYEVYNAGIQGSSIHLQNFLLETLLDTVKPNHVFFQLTGVRRYSYQLTDLSLRLVLEQAWYNVKSNYKALLLEEGVKQHFHMITPGNVDSIVKNDTQEKQDANKEYIKWVDTEMFKHQYVQALTYTCNTLKNKNYSHTFIGGNHSKFNYENEWYNKVEKIFGEKVIVPHNIMPDFEKYIVDNGMHLNPAGAEIYCKTIYEPHISTGA